MTAAEFHAPEATVIPCGPHMGRTLDSVCPGELLAIASDLGELFPEVAERVGRYLDDPTIAGLYDAFEISD